VVYAKAPFAGPVEALTEYATEAREHSASRRAEPPDPTLLTNGLETWLRSVVSAKVVKENNTPQRVSIELHDPSGDGTTVRLCDAEFLYAAILHVIHGGSFLTHDNDGDNFYWRIDVYGKARKEDTVKRQTYALRLIADTRLGSFTKEAPSFHDMTRAALGSVFVRSEKDGCAIYERGHMTGWSLDRYNERPKRAVFPTPEAYQKAMDDAYAWLEKVPLGAAPLSKATPSVPTP
jgi:hypothetical protein